MVICIKSIETTIPALILIALALGTVACTSDGSSGGEGGATGSGIIGTGGVAETGEDAWKQFASCSYVPFIEARAEDTLYHLKARNPGRYQLPYTWGGASLILVIQPGSDRVPMITMLSQEVGGCSSSSPWTHEEYGEPMLCQLQSPEFMQKCIDNMNGIESNCLSYNLTDPPRVLKNCRPATIACH